MIATSGPIPCRRDWLDRLWRFASSGRVTLALLALLALTLALSAFFPQVSAGPDNAEMERRLGAVAAAYRELGAILRTAGVFTILTSPWLRVLLALLAYNLALRLADQLHTLANVRQRVTVPPPLRPGLTTAQASVTAAPELVLATVQELMRARYPLLVSEREPDQARVYGRRGRPAALSGILLTLGQFFLLAGLLLNITTGWRIPGTPMVVRSSVKLPFAGGLQLILDQIEGDNANAAATLTLVWADGRHQSLRTGYYRPAHTGDLWIAQLSSGPALQARAYSGTRPLLLQLLADGGQASEQIRVPFRQAQPEQAFAIPAHSLTFRVVSYNSLPAQGIQGPVFLVEAYRGDEPTPVLTKLVEAEAMLAIDDVTVDLRRDRHTVLAVAYLPGMIFLGAGALLLLAGVALGVALGWGYTETWANLVYGAQASALAFRTSAPRRAHAEAERLVLATEAAFAGATGPSEERLPGETPASPGADPPSQSAPTQGA